MESRIKIPADIYALKTVGVDFWQRHYFWPISDIDFFRLTEIVLAGFDRLYEEEDQESRAVLISDAGFLVFLVRHLHALISVVECRKRNCEVLWQNLAGQFHSPRWDALADRFDSSPGFHERWKFRLRRIAKHLAFDENVALPARLVRAFRKSDVWSLGSHSRLKREYLRSRGISCDHLYIQMLMDPSPLSTGAAFPQKLASGVKSFLEDLRQEIEKRYDASFSTEEVLNCWLRRLRSFLAFYSFVQHQKWDPGKLLLTEGGNPLHKVVALALKSKGTRIVGFHHGNDMTNAWERISAYIETAHCDEFVCPTTAAARFHRKEYEMSGISRFHPVDFTSVETSHYRELFLNSLKLPFPESIQEVMIMGYPLSPFRYLDSAADFFLFQLDLEIRLMRLLREKGFRVIYKMHPDRRDEAEGVFDGLADRILSEPFEEVYQEADAYFFGCITSTTFGFALCTNRPVYVLDVKGKNWNPEAYELLSRRCQMIPGFFDERNRIQFDERLLLETIAGKPEPPDQSYVREFMFPSGGNLGNESSCIL